MSSEIVTVIRGEVETCREEFLILFGDRSSGGLVTAPDPAPQIRNRKMMRSPWARSSVGFRPFPESTVAVRGAGMLAQGTKHLDTPNAGFHGRSPTEGTERNAYNRGDGSLATDFLSTARHRTGLQGGPT